MCLVDKLEESVLSLLSNVYTLQSQDSINLIKASFQDSEIEFLEQKFILRCSYLVNQPIKYPGRGKFCEHF